MIRAGPGVIEEGACFADTLAEPAFCADRACMLALPDDADKAPKLPFSECTFGFLPMRVLSMVRTWWHSATDEAPAEGTDTTTGGSALAEVDSGTTPTWRNLLFSGVMERMTHDRAVPCCSLPWVGSRVTR